MVDYTAADPENIEPGHQCYKTSTWRTRFDDKNNALI